MADASSVSSGLASLGGSGWVVPAGSQYAPRSSPYILAQTGLQAIIPSSGSSNATGQITLTTALPYQPLGAVQLYLPAGVVTGDAVGGLKSVIFSSTTVCQIVGSPPTANAAYTQSGSEITLATATVPGGVMGANGALRVKAIWTLANTAGGKQLFTRLGAALAYQIGNASQPGAVGEASILNRNSQARQICSAGTQFGGAVTTLAVDTSVSQSLTISGQVANASDYVILEGYTVEVLPAS